MMLIFDDEDFLFFLTMKIVPIDCKFGLIVLLQNKFGANHTPPWQNIMMHKYLQCLLVLRTH